MKIIIAMLIALTLGACVDGRTGKGFIPICGVTTDCSGPPEP